MPRTPKSRLKPSAAAADAAFNRQGEKLISATMAFLDAYESASSLYQRQFAYEEVLKLVSSVLQHDRQRWQTEVYDHPSEA